MTETANPVDIQRIASEMELSAESVEVAVSLLLQDNTIPFITRYRRDETGGLEEPQLRRIHQRLQQLTSLRERKQSIIKSIQAQTEISPTLLSRIQNCFSPKLLEDLYLPYKQKKTSLAQQAREMGLQPLAEAVLAEGLSQEDFENEVAMAKGPNGEDLDPDWILRGVRILIGEAFAENIELRGKLRRTAWKSAELRSQRVAPVQDPGTEILEPGSQDRGTANPDATAALPEDSPEVTLANLITESAANTDATPASAEPAQGLSPAKKKRKRKKKRREEERFKDYFDYAEPVRQIPPHRVLAVNRGEKEKKLKVKIQLPDAQLWDVFCESAIPATHPQLELMQEAGKEALQRSLIPALEREIRRELTERAEEHAIEVFTTNLRSLMLQPPISGYRVLALDPGFKTGCKAAVLDAQGDFVDSTIISIVGNKQKKDASKEKLAELIRQHSVNLIAIGNGTGCRETELLVAELIGGPLAERNLKYVIINEAGASIYSTSEIGREEFPDVDSTIRSAISIGRRVLDPLSELVKIDPAHIGVGLYQHDVKSRHLEESLDAVVESCVNFVGVDVNTASPALLRYVAGLNQSTARKIFEHRKQHGPFANREALREVSGIGAATFVQCAGFLRIYGGDQPLDSTAIHPESYEIAQAVLDQVQTSASEWITGKSTETGAAQDVPDRWNSLDTEQLAEQLSIGRLRMQDIIDVLSRPGRDPRDSVPPPVFRSGVLDIEDLSLGMHLRGQVLNVVDFGIFVDIGLGESGLVHISNLSTGYIRDPHQYYSVGDVLDVWVDSIDRKLKRVSLTAIDPTKAKSERSHNRTSSPEGSPKSPRSEANTRKPPRKGRSGGKKAPKHRHGKQGGSSSSGPAHPQRRKSKAPNKPVKPLTEEMASGQEPMRSFSDLMQFVSIKKRPDSSSDNR